MIVKTIPTDEPGEPSLYPAPTFTCRSSINVSLDLTTPFPAPQRMMRPAAGGATVPVPKRKLSNERGRASSPAPSLPDANATASGGRPTSFFMASESMLDAGRTPTASAGASVFGVRSLNDTEEVADGGEDGTADGASGSQMSETRGDTEALSGQRRSTIKPSLLPQGDRGSRSDLARDSSISSLGSSSAAASPPRAHPLARRLPHQFSDMHSQPLTPLSFASPTLGSSAPSSPKSGRSLRPSDDDGSFGERHSNAIASSDEEVDEDDERGGVLADQVRAEAAPQLVMPSLMMPRRRPFTDNGRRLGRLKVLLAGGSGWYSAYVMREWY